MALQLILLLTALFVFGGVGFLFAASPSVASWVLVLMFITTEALVSPFRLDATLGGYSVYALDVVCFLMLAIGTARLFSRPNPRALSLPLIGLSALLVLHILWGMTTVGLQTAVTFSRPWLYVVGPLVFASQAVPRWTRESFRPLVIAAAALAGYLLIWIGQHGFKGANTPIEVGGELLESRALTGVGVLLILQCLLIAANVRLTRSALWWWLIALMGVAIVLAEYRTVWLVAFVSLVVGYFGWARRAIFVNERAALGAVSAILLIGPVAAAAGASSDALGYSARSSVGPDTTLTWRLESWSGALEAHHSPADLLLGLPAGTSLERRIGDQTTVHSVHSLYLDALLFFGVLGLAIIVFLAIQIIRHRQSAAAALGISGTTVVLIIVGNAIFGVTTMLGAAQGLLVGMLLQGAFLVRGNEPKRGSVEPGRVPGSTR